jgi:predicted RNA binding protein YcfA (HicA-like mRNA interferase family)
MSRLPVISGRELIAALEKIGYEVDRQKGSHVVLRQTIAPYRRLTIPDHKEVAKGTLRAILRQEGVSPESLDSLL